MELMVPTAFPIVRGFTSQTCGGLPAEIVDTIPAGCANNLRWLLGHCILSAERLMLWRAGRAMVSPEAWATYFTRDTSPANFDAATPAWPDLLTQLAVSADAINMELAHLDPEEELAEPFSAPRAGLHLTTRGEMVAMATWHEAMHLGQMNTYRRLLIKD